MGASRNQESTRQEKDGVVYYDRGILTGKDGRRYQRYAIKTHFVQPGEDQAELVRRYVLPLYQPGDCLSFTAKVMGMCTNNVRTLADTHPGFWAKTLAPFAGHNSTGIGMHQPYKMQLVIEICGLPRVLFAAAVSAVTRPFGIRGLFYKICGHGVAGIDGFYPDSSFEVYHTMGVINPEHPVELCDALEAATSGLQGIEAFCTANAIKYLWRWKLKNGEEDLQKAVWYINRLIQRAGADSAAGKELFNMKENKHGFEPKQEFTMGGIAWTVIQTGADWVKCIASDCVEERAFDEGNKNDFAASSLRAYLNGEFLRRLIKAGAPEEMFEYFNIDLTADDGLKNYGGDRVRIGLITCEEYRLLRGNIPALPDRWWWTATPDSPINSFVRYVYSDGSLSYDGACNGYGVRPLCNLKSEILVSYLNGENAEEQKKRAKAVDMMKHIAAAWDIDAEEVFGRADE